MNSFFSIPGQARIRQFLQRQASLSYSYQPVEGTKIAPVSGYDNDHNYLVLGKGISVWQAAKEALRNWQQFPLAWTAILPPKAPLQAGQVVAVLFRIWGLWWLNAARIVYVVDEPNRFGFAYGTLPAHMERGEECFWVELHDRGEVTYHIKAFSRPARWWVWLAYPVARWYQRRFVKQSIARMKTLANEKS